ncbi:hypothetical protein [Sphingobium sp.]|uniref:hypothetical protein n=1 Tax=Sphingobium sp. TaxID=1912891 RepID=UPI0035C74865
MASAAKGIDLTKVLIGSTQPLGPDDAGSLLKLDRLAALLRIAKEKLENGFDLSAE